MNLVTWPACILLTRKQLKYSKNITVVPQRIMELLKNNFRLQISQVIFKDMNFKWAAWHFVLPIFKLKIFSKSSYLISSA